MTLQAKFFSFVTPVLLITAVVPPAIWYFQSGREPVSPALMGQAALMVGGLIVAALLTVYFAASRLVGRPMRLMAQEMSQISTGKYDIRLVTQALRSDEVGEAARAFNQVVDAVQWTTQALQTANTGLERHYRDRTLELAHRSAELASADQKYRSIFDNGTEGIFQTSINGRCLVANHAMVQMLGYDSEAELIACVTNLATDGYADPTLREKFLELMRVEGRVDNFQAEFIQRDGDRIWISICARAVRSPDDQSIHFEGFVRNITDQKRAEWLDQDRRLLLEMIARNEPLAQTLVAVCHAAERQSEKGRSMVLLCDRSLRRVAAASQIPPEFVKAMDENLALGPTGGEENFFVQQNRFIANIHTDPSWQPLIQAAAKEGIVACQSVPIHSGHGKLLGEFLCVYNSCMEIHDHELKAMQSLAGLAGLAVEHDQLTDRLAHDAVHDPLTGLPNRAQLEARLPQWIASASRHDHFLAVLMIDLDGFKHVNDTLGHPAGDALLRQVATRLAKATRDSDVLVRMGGDEFILVATDMALPQGFSLIGGRLIQALSAPFSIEGRELFVTASVGIAVYPADGSDSATLQRNADAAMYAAKAAGRNRAMRFDPTMADAALERLELEGQLRRAISNGELLLEYQPQMDRTGEIAGVEALLRWQHPQLGRISPMRFIPLAEQSGLIVPIGAWVLSEACRQARLWQERGCRPISVAVNVSALQFQQSDFLDIVAAALVDTGLSPAYLELELTESLLLANTADAIEKVAAARAMGLGIAIDDFGTGYSSLAYLQKLPIDRLKIDQSFVRELGNGPTVTTDRSRTAIINAIASLATNLGKGIVAEGVETHAQRDYLLDIGCDVLQGYLFSKPVSAEKIQAMLRDELPNIIPRAKAA